MKEHTITLPELALVAATRGMLGAGIGLLLAGRLSDDQRKAVGRALIAVGVVTTAPLVAEIFGRKSAPSTAAARRTRADRTEQDVLVPAGLWSD
jgi:uncharacterized membrane protein YfcA